MSFTSYSSDQDRNLTSGAARVLDRVAAALAADQTSAPFQILLYELLTDENQVSELIQLSQSKIQLITATFDWGPSTENPSFADWRMTLLRHADRYAIQYDPDAVTGTEHLLLAAVELDRSTADFLTNQGVDLERLSHLVKAVEPTPDITVTEQIQFAPARSGTIDESTLFRILDASANRCREGLRVVEDFVRFVLDDQLLSHALKRIRHQLNDSLKYLRQETWIPCRDTLHDVGTTTSTSAEAYRGNSIDVVRANLKRTEESLRSLEEFSKILNPDIALQLEQSRYQFYSIEKAIESVVNSRTRLADSRLYLLVTSDACRYGIEETVRNTITAGVDIVQLREKALPDRQLLELALQLREWTHKEQTLLIINDRPDIAVACRADGVHLGQDDLTVEETRRIVGSRMLIGVSTHTIAQIHSAVFAGADYLGIGPTFPSNTKEFTEFPGLEFIQNASQTTSLPAFAIGGINEKNLDLVLHAGATRIALSSAICQTPHPRGMARAIADRLRRNAMNQNEIVS